MEMLEKGGIASLSEAEKIEKDFEYATQYGLGSELKKAVKKLGPAIGAVIGGMIGGPAGAAIGAGVGTKTSASDNYAQNMLGAFLLSSAAGMQGQGMNVFKQNPITSFQQSFAGFDESTIGTMLGKNKAAQVDALSKSGQADILKRINELNATGITDPDKILSSLNTEFGRGTISDAIRMGGGQGYGPISAAREVPILGTAINLGEGLASFAADNPLLTQLAMPKIVEAIYGEDPYGTSANLSFASQNLTPGVNLNVNPYIEGSRVNAPQFPNLEQFVGAKRAMFGGKIGNNYKEGGKPLVRPDGQVTGPGTPTSDDIPVYLSDQEYVMPKVMVDYFGNGDYDNGIAALEQIRTRLV